jgi:hypothetical protein
VVPCFVRMHHGSSRRFAPATARVASCHDGSDAASRGRTQIVVVVEELDAVGAIEGLGHALGLLGRAGTHAFWGFQAHARLLSAYGHGDG